jgi:hypothetical protein
MKKLSLSKLIMTVFPFMGCILFSCDNFNTLPDDFEDAMDLKINADLKLTFGTIAVFDANDEQPVTGPVTAVFRKDKKDSAMIVSIEGKQVDKATFTGGIFQFALNKGYNPPLDLPLTVYTEGYDTFYTVITFSKSQLQQFTFSLHKKTSTGAGRNGGPVSGLGVKDTVLGNIGSDRKVPLDLTLSVTTSRATEIAQAASSSDLVTTVSIPVGTMLFNKKGEPLQGEIEAKSGYYDVSNQTAIANLPGSLLPVAPGTSPNEPLAFSAIAGIPVRVSGVPGSTGVEQTSFISAGLLSLDISVNGVSVDSFSQPISVKMEMADSIINPQTGFPIRDGDTIDIWSIGKKDSAWQWEGKAVIRGPSVNGKLSSEFLIRHLSYWNLDWFSSAVCPENALLVTGVPSDINLYMEPTVVYPSGNVINYYHRQIMDVDGSNRTMIFKNVPKGYSLKFKFYTSEYGSVAFESIVPVSDSCAAMVVACPSGIVSDQMRLTVIATDSSGVPVGPQYLYMYGSVPSMSQTFYVYSQNDTFNVTVPVSAASTFTIYSNGSPVGIYSITGKDDPAITGGVLKIPAAVPAKCIFKAAIKGAIPGSYIYLDAIVDSKGANPRSYGKYYFITNADTTLVCDQFLRDRFVKFSLYTVYGVQIPVVKDYEILMSSLFCGQSIAIDLQSFYCRPKVVLHNTSISRAPYNITIRTYAPSFPGSPIPGSSPSILFTRTNTTDTVFYPEALPSKWPVEIIVSGTHYDSCSLTSVIDIGRFEKQVLDTGYTDWNKSIVVNIDDSKLEIPDMVKIPINISIKCSNMEITPSITFYYKLDCESQRWTTGYLSMGKATLYLQLGRSYIFAIYDPQTGALKSGTMTVTDDLIVRANASANGANLYDEITSPDVKEVLDKFCSRM